jgi:serine/threonine-protein kinase PpkA
MSRFPSVPGFEFTALLGRGGMATVYSAVETGLERQVAIKVVDPHGHDAEQYLQRLENEAQSLAGLQHPNIVDLYRYGRTEDGALYYVMPLLDGGDLSTWPKPIAEAELVELLATLLDALDHAHAAGIVHRDIKPENILFDHQQRPMLADFGAALRPSRPRTTQVGMAIGSTGYMSPEQARGGEVDPRSDLYSLAVLAYEMLVGELPFDGPDALAVALAQVEQPVPRLPAPLAHWQPWFDRALAIEPAQRFASAAAMAEALHVLRRKPPRPALPRLRWYNAAALALLLLPPSLALWLFDERPPSAEQIAALIQQQALLPPSRPNALDALLQARARAPADRELDALQALLLDVLAMEMAPALQQADLAALQPHWRQWRTAVQWLAAEDSELVRLHQQPVAERLRQTLQDAGSRFDRHAAEAAFELLDHWPDADPALQSLAAEVRQLPLEGERFRDPDGPELLLVRRPHGGQAGLAVMADALQPGLYRRFVTATRRRPRDCPGAPEGLQACIDLGEAQALAAWLSSESGQSYRVPSRRELASVIGHVRQSPLLAWTTTCHQVATVTAPSVPQRAWGGVRKAFGGRSAEPRVEHRCDGYLALPLDGRGSGARALAAATAQTTVVLLRDVAALDAVTHVSQADRG